jgi:predicted RNase H-like HicB family nuclease
MKSLETYVRNIMNFVVMLKEGDTYIAWSPILDESSEGSTIEEAKHGLEDAVRLRLDDKNMPLPKVKVEGFYMATKAFIPVSGGDVCAENS